MGGHRTLAAIALPIALFMLLHSVFPGPGVATGAYWTVATGGNLTALAVADLDQDGWAEIIGGTDEGEVILWTADGQRLWDFKIETDWVTGLSSADLDGDGSNEVLVTAAGILPTNYFYVLRHDGSLWWSRAVREDLWSVLTVDLDGDPALELLLAARRPLALDTDGLELPDQPTDLLRTPHIHLADWDGDGATEVVTLMPETLSVLELSGASRSFPVSLPSAVQATRVEDVDQDGSLELVALTHSALMVLERTGAVRLNWPLVGEPGELGVIPAASSGSGQARIVFSQSSGIIALGPSGENVWAFDGGLPDGRPFTLMTHGGWLVAGTEGGQAYLLDAAGRRLSEYDQGGPISNAQVADLNGDGRPEVLLAANDMLGVFGMPSGGMELHDRWRYAARAPVVALAPNDAEPDGRAEVLVGGRNGRVTMLDGKGSPLWERDPWSQLGGLASDGAAGFLIWSDTDLHRYDGHGTLLWQAEFAGMVRKAAPAPAGVAVLIDDGTVVLLSSADGRRIRSANLQSPARDLEAAEGGVVLITEDGSAVFLDAGFVQRWQTPLGGANALVASVHDRMFTIRLGDRLVSLDEDGVVAWDWSVQPAERVTGVDLGEQLLAIGTDSRAVILDRQGVEIRALPLEEVASAVDVLDIDGDGAEEVAVGTVRGTLLVYSSGGEEIWRARARERVNALAAADLNGDDLPEILTAFEDGAVIAYGMTLKQPPWIGSPSVSAVGDGYQYAVRVHDPDGDPVSVALEIWDPSSRTWSPHGEASSLTGEGTLTWNVPNPFDTWDAGKDSAFRFTWDDGLESGTTASATGPLQLPVDPWYLTYGRVLGLGILITAVPTLLLIITRRTRAFRRSPLGQAETAWLRLQLDPEQTLHELQTLLSDEKRAIALLDHMPGLAREAGEESLADLLAGVHLALTRPDLMVEALRAISDALGQMTNGESMELAKHFYTTSLLGLSASSLPEIAGLLEPMSNASGGLADPEPRFSAVAPMTDRFNLVVRTIRAAEQIEATSDRIAYLAEAAAELASLERQAESGLVGLERKVLMAVARHWLGLVTGTLEALRGRAELDLRMDTHQVVLVEEVVLAVTLTNRGRSPGNDLSIELDPGKGLVPQTEPIRVKALEAGTSLRLEITARPTGTAGIFGVMFRVAWNDRERSGKESRFTDHIRVIPAPQAFSPIPNPYATGRPLAAGSPVFVGRDDLLRFTTEKVDGGHIVVLVGERRMGKTSILRQLPSRLGTTWAVAFIDAQGLGLEGGLAHWLADAALEISRASGWHYSPSPADLGSQPGPAFQDYVREVAEGLHEKRRLLILLDEFEEIESRVREGDLPPAIFPFLRHVMQSSEVDFLLAGTHRLERLSPHYWSPLFNIGIYREVGPLDQIAAQELITGPVEGKLLYDDLAIDKMLRISGNQPYFLQLLCHCVVAWCNRVRRAYITASELDVAVEEALSLGQAHLRFLTEGVPERQRAVLAVLARLLAEGEPGTVEMVTDRIGASGLTPEGPSADEALKNLMGRGLISRSKDGRYTFAADLLRMWIERSAD